ncbi:MAG: hypothetical protein ABIR27_11675 [Dokdonella sp.]
MQKISGFSRLKGLAAASAITVAGFVSGGAARAASTAIPLDVVRSSARWSSIDNNGNFPSSDTVTSSNGDVFTTNMQGYGIGDAAFGGAAAAAGVNGSGSGYSDAFDNAMILSVNGTLFQNPDSTVDLTGDTVTSDTVTIVPGIDAQVRYTFITGRPVVRALYSLTNTTAAPISVNAAVLGDYGSDGNTEVVATSNGNTTIEGSDFWYITDDQGTGAPKRVKKNRSPDGKGGGDPRVTLSRYGTGAEVIPSNALIPGNGDSQTAMFGLRYPVTIAPGATARVLVFAQLSDPTAPVADAAAAAADFESVAAMQSAGLLTGITAEETSQIVNYVRPGGPVPVAEAVDLPTLSPAGLLTLLGAMGGFGYVALRRRKKATIA